MFERLLTTLGMGAEQKEQKIIADLLYNIVNPLKALDADYPEQLAAYILTGEHAHVLLALQSRTDDDAAILLNQPGTLNWWHPQPGSQSLIQNSKKLTNQSKNARVNFYQHFGQNLRPEQAVRYGKFLAALTRGQNYTALSAQVPSWFAYFMVDGLHSSLGDSSLNKNMQFRKHWTVQALHDMLQSEHLDGTLVLNLLFDRANLYEYSWSNLDLFYRLPDFEAYILAHRDAFAGLYLQLSANGQHNLLNYLERTPAVAQHFPGLVIGCALQGNKKARLIAQSLLPNLKEDDVQQLLAEKLQHGIAKEKAGAAELLARSGLAAKPVLQAALAQEKSKAVIQAIEQALARLASLDHAKEDEEFAIPAFEPIVFQKLPASVKELLQENYQAVLEKARADAEQEQEDNKTRDWKSSWRQDSYKRLKNIGGKKLAEYADIINGDLKSKTDLDPQVIFYKNRLQQLPEYNLVHFLKITGQRHRRQDGLHLSSYILDDYFKADGYQNLELRQLADAVTQAGYENADKIVGLLLLQSNYDDLIERLAPEHVWPFYAERQDLLAEALGLLPSQLTGYYASYDIEHTLKILSYFPKLPVRFIPRLLELALGEGKSHRLQAQLLLERLGDIRLRAEEALSSSKQEIRIVAAEWLARLGDPLAVAALNQALKKEKREVVIAALLTSLERLGEDISAYLSADFLLKEARKGLKGKLPSSLLWLLDKPFPQLAWQNGQVAEDEIIRWWAVLAHKLKEPAGNALLQRYLSLLSASSQQQLGEFLLDGFIRQDTRHPSQDEALQEANQHAPNRLAGYKNSFKNYGQKYPEYYGRYEHITLEQVVEEIKREALSRYLGSAIGDKGILALAAGVQGHKAVHFIQQYMKDHYQRRAQIEAMIAAVANSDDPVMIQFLLSIARRYRTASVQEKARGLIEAIAERNGWSNDELADRTIPTAGFDEHGILTLSYGGRDFKVSLDESYKFVLKNEEGKEIKALPAARQTDDEELAKEAKKQFSSSKKELKQILDLQTARLYEAMCANRRWAAAEWQQYLAQHPIMKRLIQRLVWQEVADDQVLNTFRPAEDGSLINAEDDEIELAADSQIQLAHAALMDEASRQDWQQHLKDYKVKPLFAQLGHLLPELDVQDKDAVDDRLGWMSDTFTLRGVMNKLGYQRGQAEDGGVFDYYHKPFNSLGLTAYIGFSGSYLPEENMPAALYRLSFSRNKGSSWNRTDLALNDVPKILFAECYADYHAAAAACRGFDPEWEKKTPW